MRIDDRAGDRMSRAEWREVYDRLVKEQRNAYASGDMRAYDDAISALADHTKRMPRVIA